ncbi:MAG TPA: hypothetical protein VM537_33795 [Anaerolineae bacterium]|nr:hypothetical protein [Anaerolineae bacterium]
MRQNSPDSYPTNDFTLNMACVQVDAILRALGCADEKGEVFVPDVRRAIRLIREAQFHGKRGEHARLENAAIRALTGGSDEQ